MSEVVVVGAGVIGLASALSILESNPSAKVTIIAKYFPNDPLSPQFTSPWAGAHFRPFPSVDEKAFADSKFTRVTLSKFEQLAASEPESSIKFMEGIDIVEDKGIYNVNAKGYYENIKDLRELSREEIAKVSNGGKAVACGYSYRTWVLNAPLFIQYLQRKLEFEYGVKFVRQELNSLKQVHVQYPNAVIVNASGLGLQYNGGYDSESFPIRGQTLLIRPPPSFKQDKTVTYQAKDGSWTFYIPRPLNGGVILGGTKQIGETFAGIREEDTAALIKRGKDLFPELFHNGEALDIHRVNVGFRPARKDGVRVELEKVDNATIIHAYGAGGMGYELSFGVGSKVADLLNFRKSKL